MVTWRKVLAAVQITVLLKMTQNCGSRKTLRYWLIPVIRQSRMR